MTPRLSERSNRTDGRGQSFRDLSAYLFNGERGKPNPDRAVWSETINCYCSDPSQAWAEMAWTYEHADELKKADQLKRGLKPRGGGQKNDHPVWHVSLNWKAGEEPSRDEMMKAAQSVLKKFGLEEHQALVVFHDDTDHHHVHLMVSTVNPHTGRTVDVSRSTKYRLSAWALEYERERGEIQCEQRVENWKKRDQNKTLRKVWNQMTQAKPELGEAKQDKTYGKSDSRPLWQLKKQAKDSGLTPESLSKLGEQFRAAWNQHFKNERAEEAGRAQVPAQDPTAILERIARAQSTFTRAELAKAVNAVTKDPEEFSATFHKVLASPELVKLDTQGSEGRYSTQTTVRIEAEMAKAADELAVSYKHGVTAARSRSATAEKLSDQQRAALDHITDADGLACVVGYAGAGKSMMLGAARELWEASGYNVKGFALSGIAAESLEGGSGITSTTLAALKWGLDKGRTKLTSKDVLVIDEAGMIGSRQMHGVLTAAEKAGAKVVLVGDPSQLQAIEAGGAFRTIVERMGAATITEVRRQRQRWQQDATRHLAVGNVEAALTAYMSHSRAVKSHESKDGAIAGLVAEWAKDLHERTPGIILAATRNDVADLNDEAREAMRRAGLLGKDFKIEAREETLDKPARDFRLQLADGERLMFTKNDKGLGVKNGTLGTLERHDGGKLTIKLDGDQPRRVEVDLTSYRNLAYGYALTVHKAQGVTVDRSYVLASRAMDRHSAYVALSRHRDSVSIHYSRTDARNLESLARRLSRERPKDTTLDYTKPPAPQRAPYQKRARRAERQMLSGTLSKIVGSKKATSASRQFDDVRQYMMQGKPNLNNGRVR